MQGADVAGDELPVRCEGLMLSLLGTADPATLSQVIDRYGLHWLIGYEDGDSD